ncbi:unnamed protein product [Calypogeia fissa]
MMELASAANPTAMTTTMVSSLSPQHSLAKAFTGATETMCMSRITAGRSSFCGASGRIRTNRNGGSRCGFGSSATAQETVKRCVSVLRSNGMARAASGAEQETQKNRSYRIVTLPGDGVGPEIMTVAVDILRSVGKQHGIKFDIIEKPIGGAAIDATGVPLPDDSLAACRGADAVLLASIGGYKWDTIPTHLRPEQGLLQLRAGLGVFANLRPAVVLPQLVDASTLKREIAEGVDIMVVRELIGDIYFGKPKGFGVNEEGHEYAYNTMVYSIPEIERIARVAFETARKRKGKVCSVDKANVLSVSQLWRKTVTEIGANEYLDVELSHMYVDNAAMQLVRNPKQFDTIVTGNLFGDILSDISAMLSGSIGMLASASIASSGPGLYEPIHGSAPDIAGQDKANPMAQVLSAAMMLRYGLGEEQAANAIESTVSAVLDKNYRTGDILSSGMTLVGCKRMGELLLEELEASAPVPVLR